MGSHYSFQPGACSRYCRAACSGRSTCCSRSRSWAYHVQCRDATSLPIAHEMRCSHTSISAYGDRAGFSHDAWLHVLQLEARAAAVAEHAPGVRYSQPPEAVQGFQPSPFEQPASMPQVRSLADTRTVQMPAPLLVLNMLAAAKLMCALSVSAHTPLEGQFVSRCCLMSRLSAKKYRWRQSLTLGWAAGGCWYGSKLVTQRRGNTPAVPADADGCGRALHPTSVLLTCGPCSWGALFLAASKPGPLFSAAACWWLFPVPCCCSPAPREQGSAGVSCLALIHS